MVGRNIRRKRKARGIGQTELAKAVGVSQAFLSELERGTKEPSLERLQVIAEALGCRPAELLEMAAEPGRPAYQAGAGGARAIMSDYGAPAGLRALASDQPLVEALKVTAEEWAALRAVPLERVNKEGYLQILVTFRSVTQT